MEQQQLAKVLETGDLGELLGIINQPNLLTTLNSTQMCRIIKGLGQVVEQQAAQLTQVNRQLKPEITNRKQTQEKSLQGDQQLEYQFQKQTTELSEANQQLRQAKEQLEAVLDAVPGAVSWISADGRYLGVNRHLAQSLQLPPETFVGQELGFLHSSPQFVGFMGQFLACGESAASQVVELKVKNSSKYYLIAAQKYQQGAAAVCVGIDITKHKQAELALQQLNQELELRVEQRTADLRTVNEQLRKSEEQFRLIFELSPMGMAITSTDDSVLQVNQAFCDTVGYTANELGQKKVKDIIYPDDLTINLTPNQELWPGRTSHFQMENRLLSKDGRVIHVLTKKAVLVRDAQGKPRKFLYQIVDITERKQAENQVRASLTEKEVLLKEIHHRVKNNLQIISSLLRLQSRKVEDPQALSLFKDSQHRVQSMALIHQQLYQSPNLAQINFGKYIQTLTNNLFRSYGINRHKIGLNIEVTTAPLTIDIAIPCGLIINELVSNSLKYAFPEHQYGKIEISLSSDQQDQLILTVSDNGIGLPENLDFQATKSLGLSIVRNLTAQLGGNIILDCSQGTRLKINFPNSLDL
ncbi:histidine kinase dimerization/phosphoacceptor domain -containing protein [Moorena sp. SIO3H5]|uniref:histidine kinase dimerization/phosphoacceptor domain -containing protein n=1 Tax=Moorena sp. SIO3H5 TaxID=2607834 RepID=UPI0013BE4E91|nr:histidine kinase dimerization/phosphoacceptor domain -containing protein [Moorena sp. SIO3H5]NEO69339.1 PAS domain S-box protein [Moorena sp. SIO3H5]